MTLCLIEFETVRTLAFGIIFDVEKAVAGAAAGILSQDFCDENESLLHRTSRMSDMIFSASHES